MKLPYGLIATFLSFISINPLLSAQDAPNPSEIRINGINYSGTGCPNGTVGQSLSSDGQAFTLTFSQYMVSRDGANNETGDACGANLFSPNGNGNGHPLAGPRAGNRPISCRRCQIQLNMTPPQGWSYALFSMQVRGYATLDQGAQGIQNGRISFGRGQKNKLGRMVIDGPYDNDYERADDIPLRSLVWSKCNQPPQPLEIETVIAVKTRDDARGMMTVDSIDGSLNQQYGIIWRRCNGGGGGGGGNRPAFAASCKSSLTIPSQGNLVKREFMAQGRSDISIADAQQKASAKAQQKCENRRRTDGNAVCQPAVCQGAQL